jgi:hypothetical protein
MPVTLVVTCGFEGFLLKPGIAELSEEDRAHLGRPGCWNDGSTAGDVRAGTLPKGRWEASRQNCL